LFEEVGLRGNTDEYYEPENSYLNKVLDRKLGIPISLSVIYLEVARRLGLAIDGVNFPGHFLLRVQTDDQPLIIDAFEKGKRLDNTDLNARLATVYEDQAPRIEDAAHLLRPASAKEVLVRMLRNLKNIYIQNQQAEQGLMIVELILRLVPESPDELRDRGMIYHHLDYSPAALADLNRYLELVPDGPERPVVEALVESLEKQDTSLH
jgi:regulator of sirC expression with transglutaminase-like and TPR domain